MKKILFPIAAFAFSLAACNSTPKFTVNGTVEGEQTGNVFLLKMNGQEVDTLAKSAIAEGKFVLTGSVENLTNGTIVVEGKRRGTPIMIENATFTATLNPANPAESKIEGTETQKLFNDFMAIGNGIRKVQSELYNEYGAASQAKDTAKMKEVEARFNTLAENAQAKEDSLVSANSDSYIAAYILSSKMGGLDAEELSAKYETLGVNAKATEPGKKIAERIEKLNAVAVGKVAPDFTLNTPDGTPMSMHSIKGKVKLIDFWASWCGPCRGENPNVVKVYEEFHPKGLEILSVSLDNDKDAWLKAIEDDKLTWNHVSDLKGWGNEAAQLYAVNGIPHLVLVDENNVIIAKNLRGEALKEKIAELLK